MQTPDITPSHSPLAVRYSACVFEPTGYGAAARGYVHALHTAGVQLSVRDRFPRAVRPVDDPLVASLLDRTVETDLQIWHGEPTSLSHETASLASLIVLTTFESDRLPESHVSVLNRVREVWTPSRYNVETYRKFLQVPVFHLPHTVNPKVWQVNPDQYAAACRDFLKVEDSDFVFTSVATWQERKNLAATVAAFFRAFPTEANVKLIIKTSFQFVSAAVANAQIVRELVRYVPSIDANQLALRLRLVDANWSEEAIRLLLRRSDCYLSLHRGEGWCYPLFDAVCAGTPVIATAYSGPLDYLDPRFHLLVDYRLVSAERGDDPAGFPFTPDMKWAEPDVVHASHQMQVVYGHRAQIREFAQTGAAQIQKQFSLEAIGRAARERLLALEPLS